MYGRVVYVCGSHGWAHSRTIHFRRASDLRCSLAAILRQTPTRFQLPSRSFEATPWTSFHQSGVGAWIPSRKQKLLYKHGVNSKQAPCCVLTKFKI